MITLVRMHGDEIREVNEDSGDPTYCQGPSLDSLDDAASSSAGVSAHNAHARKRPLGPHSGGFELDARWALCKRPS
eukprot:3013409-Amphidinium_carterae.1